MGFFEIPGEDSEREAARERYDQLRLRQTEADSGPEVFVREFYTNLRPQLNDAYTRAKNGATKEMVIKVPISGFVSCRDINDALAEATAAASDNTEDAVVIDMLSRKAAEVSGPGPSRLIPDAVFDHESGMYIS